MQKTILFVLVAVLGLAAGVAVQKYMQPASTSVAEKPAQGVPASAPAFTLKDLEGTLRSSKEWQGKVVMVNFWASWCPPCRREIPAFIRLQETYAEQGFVIVGIALDNRQNVVDFSDPLAINYPILLAEEEGIALARAYGNQLGVLPYTVIVDRTGKIVYTHRSELTYEVAEEVIKPLL